MTTAIEQTEMNMMGQHSHQTRTARLSRAVLMSVVFVSMIAPLATDMYVPGFPLVARDLDASATQVQLTLTTYFVGMALGQLVGGPVSDQRGRRMPLLISLAVMTLASIVCAIAPTIAVMMIARLVQGLAGGWAMVTARAIVVDLSSGSGLVRALNLIAGVGGIAPIAGPLLGAVILELTHWRVSFWAVAAFGLAMTVTVALAVQESLPADKRHGGGLGQLLGASGKVLARPAFVGYLIVMAFSMGITFAYVATSAFILQNMNGLSPILYSVDFAANAVGLTVATLVAARLAGRVATRLVIGIGIIGSALAGLLLLFGALWFGTPLWVALVAFFVLMSAQGTGRSERWRAGFGGGARASRHRLGAARLSAVVHGWCGRPDRGPGRRCDRGADGGDHSRAGRGVAGGAARAGAPPLTDTGDGHRAGASNAKVPALLWGSAVNDE